MAREQVGCKDGKRHVIDADRGCSKAHLERRLIDRNAPCVTAVLVPKVKNSEASYSSFLQ